MALAVTTTVLVMAFLFREVAGVETSAEVVGQARWSLLAIPLGLLCVSLMLSVLKWQVVLAASGHPLRFASGLRAFVTAFPFSAVTPSRAGDLVRAYLIRDTAPGMVALGSVLADRLIDIQSLCVLALIGALAAGFHGAAAAIAVAIVLGWGVGVTLLRRRSGWLSWPLVSRFRTQFEQLCVTFEALLARPRYLAAASGVSLMVWVLVQTMFYSLVLVYQAGVELWHAIALWPLSTLVGLVPVTLAGMGTRDGAFLYLVELASGAQADRAAVLLATFSYSIVSSWVLAIIGLPLTIRFALRGDGAYQGAPPRGANNS